MIPAATRLARSAVYWCIPNVGERIRYTKRVLQNAG